jgi:hypothetical protein
LKKVLVDFCGGSYNKYRKLDTGCSILDLHHTRQFAWTSCRGKLSDFMRKGICMLKVFEKKLWVVRLRCSINLLLKQGGRVLTGAGIIAVLCVLTERLLAVSIINSGTLWVFGGVVACLVFLLWLLTARAFQHDIGTGRF